MFAAAAILLLWIPTAVRAQDTHDTEDDGWKITQWEVQCIEPKDCAPADDVYAHQLGEASRWLKSLGFWAPRIEKSRDGRRYMARVDDTRNMRDTDEQSLGVYVPGEQMVYLDSDSFFAMGDPDGDVEQSYLIDLGNTFTPTHELFHAVEAAYHDDLPDISDWIWEGMADAVQVAYGHAHEPGEVGILGARFFDDPLDRPGRTQGRQKRHAYGSWVFWYLTGKYLESPGRAAYLHTILQQKALQKGTGLEGVDDGLKTNGWGGLYHVFPGFCTTFKEPAKFFLRDINRTASLPSGRRESTTTITETVDAVSGRYLELEVRKSTGRAVEVEIRFKKDHPDLHLVVDQVRYDLASLGPRNVVRYLLVEEDETTMDVIVVNVAKNAVETRDHRPFALEVTLREVGYCSMAASWNGDLSGATFGDVAHFSTRGGATIYGSFSNPETVGPMIDSLGGFMAARAENEKEAEAIREETAAMRRELEAQSKELPREALGISLADLKLDVEDEETAGLAHLAGGFQLQLSVLGDGLARDFTGPLNPDLVQVMPGPRARSTFDKVRFVWVRGMPDPPRLTITHNKNGLMTGALMATLRAEGYTRDDGSIPLIRVKARFVARAGPLGCMTPF